MEENYYVCDNFSSSLYIKLARAGFISTSVQLTSKKYYLLPEIQFEYAVLEFKDLHISKKVRKIMNKNNYIFQESKNIEDIKNIINSINNYHKDSWICKEYEEMLLELFQKKSKDFKLLGFELFDKQTKELIAGELGYKIGNIYTSLTGFLKKEKKYNNFGKLQLVLLSKYLENSSYDFWNLGHACLEYKIDLGSKILKRDEFLEKWFKSIRNSEIH